MSKMKNCSLCSKSLRLRRRRMNPDMMTMRCYDCDEPDKISEAVEPAKSVREEPKIGQPTNLARKKTAQIVKQPGDRKHGVNGKVVGPEMYVRKKVKNTFSPVIGEVKKKKKKES